MNLQEDWGIYMATKKRTMKLKCTEFDEEFSEEYAEGTTVSLEGPQRSRIKSSLSFFLLSNLNNS